MAFINRRTALKVILSAGGGFSAAAFLPEKWVKPVLSTGVLPAHAQNSNNNEFYGVSVDEDNGHLLAYTYILAPYQPGGRHNAAPLRISDPAAGKQVTITGLDTDSAGSTNAIRPALNASGITGSDGTYDFGAIDKSTFCMVEWTITAANNETDSYKSDECAAEVYQISLDGVEGDLVATTYTTTAYHPGRRHNAAPLRTTTPVADKLVTLTGCNTSGAGVVGDITPLINSSGTTGDDGTYNFGAMYAPDTFSHVTYVVKAANKETAYYNLR